MRYSVPAKVQAFFSTITGRPIAKASAMLPGPGFSRYGFSSSAVPTCLAKECLSATLDRTKLVSRPVPVRGQVRFRSALAELLRRQGEALGPNSWNGTSLSGDDRSCQYPVSKRKRDSSSLPPQHAQRRRVLGTPSLRSSE